MRRGFTLIELVIALAVAGLLGAIAAPRLTTLLASVQTDSATRRVTVAIATARVTAVMQNRITVLTLRPDSLLLWVVSGQDSALVWSAPGPAAESVSFTGPDRPVSFGPNGLARGVSNATFRLARGTTVRQVIVSRLGRVRVVRQP